ncbi:MAG: ABC transporter ATP-binding protein [Acidobacteriota bacterium]|nr:ABC transporter ATP-binding protein [Acidobacteriota bacterium]
MRELLHVRALTVDLPTARGWVRPVNELSLRIGAGESLGLVGESGSGKTMLALALMGLLPPGAKTGGKAILTTQSAAKKNSPEAQNLEYLAAEQNVSSGRNLNVGCNLATLNETEWRRKRGLDVAMIFQEPMTSLNPVMRVGDQIAEAITAHHKNMQAAEVERCVLEALRLAAVPEPAIRSQQFPHQLSGGLRQRVMIAMAIAAGVRDQSVDAAPLEQRVMGKPMSHPRLLIADEPTTALDVTVQKQILELLDALRRKLGLGLLFITHDLGAVARVADRVAVMYAGRIVEEGPVGEVLRFPRHPYTQGLIAASPTLERGRLTPIAGVVPQLTELPPGCSFEPRCSLRLPECRETIPALRNAGINHAARCILVGDEVVHELR